MCISGLFLVRTMSLSIDLLADKASSCIIRKVRADVHLVDERTAITAGQIVDEIEPDDPYLDGPDELIATVGRELDALMVSGAGDLTHSETTRVITVEEY